MLGGGTGKTLRKWRKTPRRSWFVCCRQLHFAVTSRYDAALQTATIGECISLHSFGKESEREEKKMFSFMWQWAEAMTVNNRKREGEKRKATHWPQNVLTLASARLERESGPRGPFACLLASFSLSFHRLLTIAASAGFQFSAPRLHRRPGQIRRSQQLLCFWPRRPPPSRMSDERNNYLILTLFLSLNLPPLAAWGSDAVRVLSFSLSKPNWKSASRAVLHSDYAALYLFGSIGVLAFFFSFFGTVNSLSLSQIFLSF